MFDVTADDTAASVPSPLLQSRTPLRITCIDSAQLLAGAREVVIEHAGQHYHLRLTRNDKLILTK